VPQALVDVLQHVVLLHLMGAAGLDHDLHAVHDPHVLGELAQREQQTFPLLQQDAVGDLDVLRPERAVNLQVLLEQRAPPERHQREAGYNVHPGPEDRRVGGHDHQPADAEQQEEQGSGGVEDRPCPALERSTGASGRSPAVRAVVRQKPDGWTRS